MKKIRDSKYKGVFLMETKDTPWLMRIGKYQKRHQTEIDAAIAYDLLMMSQGREPVNIYKRK